MAAKHTLLLREMFRLSLRNFRVKPVRAILTQYGATLPAVVRMAVAAPVLVREV